MSITSVVNDNVGDSSFVNAQKPNPPSITGYVVQGTDDTALLPAGGQTVLVNGSGFQRGATVSIGGTAVAVTTWVNGGQLSFTSPAKTAGTYTLFVINADGGTAIYVPGLIYSTNPTWVTAAGSLGSYYETTAISNTVVATDDTGSAITYSLTSGSLPSGATLAANGVISGTAPVDSGSTTYSFTIDATDTTQQSTSRSFSLTINTDVVTWVTPANGATIAVSPGAYSLGLVATDAAGYAVSYAANTLPTGLSLTGNTISGTPTISQSVSTLLTATADTTNRSATNTITWTVTLSDAYWAYVTTLLSAEVNTLPFNEDASTNNFALTISGDTQPNNRNPYTAGYYSNYFDGTGDYLSFSGVALTGDFTVECWIYKISSPSGYATIINNASSPNTGGSQFTVDNTTAGSIGLYIQNTNVISPSGTAVTNNQWHHIAWTRSGSTCRAFVNGVLQGSGTYSGTTGLMNLVNSYSSGGYSMQGYISNLRIVSGTAVYTANFTVPTAPLTAISGTSLLTCESNRFLDNSTNSFAITANGDTAVRSFAPFAVSSSYATYGSGYFDGTGDYLTLLANAAFVPAGDFTLECWVYRTASAANYTIAGYSSTSSTVYSLRFNTSGNIIFLWYNTSVTAYTATSSTTVAANAWHHVAVTFEGSNIKLWVNGSLSATVAFTGSTRSVAGPFLGIGSWGASTTEPRMLGYISNFRIVNGTAVYTANFTPPTTPLTAIANTSLLTLQYNQSVNNNVFMDNSSNNFLITRNGNTTQGTFSPYAGTWSNYFDGTDYFSVTAPAFGTSNFTMECWVYFTDLSNEPFIFGNQIGSVQFYVNTSQVRVYSGSQIIACSGTVSTYTWYHFALVRNSGTLTMYIDGVDRGNVSNTTNFTTTTYYIGTASTAAGNASYSMIGYISNARIVNGTAVYTAAFTPPTAPLLPITNTTLLTCATNRYIDLGPNNLTITRAGDVNVQKFSPFSLQTQPVPTSYSGYFDGSGDYLSLTGTALGTGNFTIQFWLFASSMSSTFAPFSYGTSDTGSNGQIYIGTNGQIYWYNNGERITSASGVIGANTWYHIAVCKSSNVTKLFVNGTQVGSNYADTTNYTSTTIYIGQGYGVASLTGYVSNFRQTNTAEYTANFAVPTAPLTAISGTSLLTCQSTTFIDNSTNSFPITVVGNSQPLPQNPFGYTNPTAGEYTAAALGGSMYFDGSGDYLNLASSDVVLQNDFTIEFWFYPLNTTFAGLAQTRNGASFTANDFQWHWDTSTVVFYTAAGNIATTTVELKSWNHVAVARSGSTISIYLNGKFCNSFSNSNTFNGNGGLFRIGELFDGTHYYFTGYISDFRVIQGQALYTSSFVPPAAPLTAVAKTGLLVPGTAGGIIDSACITTYETAGDAKLDTAVVQYGNDSMYFDGTGDVLKAIDYNLNYAFGAGDFTIEFWLRPTSLSSAEVLPISAQYSGGYYSYAPYIHNSVVKIIYYTASQGQVTQSSGISVSTNTWFHIAYTRSGSNARIFVNGVLGNTTTLTGALGTPINLSIGGRADGLYLITGYMQDVRITKGYARYTATFTPPSEPFIRY